MSDKRHGGVRTRPTERNRIPLGIRITPQLREELLSRANASGRSITQEVEMLLEKVLYDDRIEAHLLEIKRLVTERVVVTILSTMPNP